MNIKCSRLKESSNHNEDRVKLMLKKLKVNFCIIVIVYFWNGKTLWNTKIWIFILEFKQRDLFFDLLKNILKKKKNIYKLS